MTTQHTSGPWLVMNSHRKDACEIIHQRSEDDRTDHICSLDAYIGNRANARLIAAAPELLELLIDLEAALSKGQISRATVNRDGDLVTQIRAAISKAKGQ